MANVNFGRLLSRLIKDRFRLRVERTFGREADRLATGLLAAGDVNRSVVNHAFQDYRIALVLGGSGRFIDACGATSSLAPGSCVQRLPDRPHTLVRTGDGRWVEFYLVLPRSLAEGLLALGLLDARRLVLNVGCDAPLIERIARLLADLNNAIHRDPATCLMDAQRFLIELHERDRFRCGARADDDALRRAGELLRQDPAGRTGVPAVAATCGMGYEKFRKLFALRYGVPPHQYRLRCRMDEARRLLMDGSLGIKEIAFALGYPEVANFAHQFRQVVGMSPGKYRRRR